MLSGDTDETSRFVRLENSPHKRQANFNSLKLFKKKFYQKKPLKFKLIDGEKMAEKERTTAPAGMAGLVRYEEEESLIKMKPEHVIALCTGLIILEIVLFIFVKV